MIIKLTLAKSEDGLTDLLINTDLILYAAEGSLEPFGYDGVGTVIKMTDDTHAVVKETPKEIVEVMTVYKRFWS